MLKRDLGMGHGDANTLVHHVLNACAGASPRRVTGSRSTRSSPASTRAQGRASSDPRRADGRVAKFGEFEIAPKKTYLSLRRRKQFAMVGPATNTRVEVGLNMKGVAGTERLVALPPGGMCNYKVKLASPTRSTPRWSRGSGRRTTRQGSKRLVNARNFEPGSVFARLSMR